MLETVKGLLGITDSSKDIPLTFIMNKLTAQVRGYCNVSENELPGDLQLILIDMAIDTYRVRDYGQEQSEPVVSSVSEGDASVSFFAAGKSTPEEVFSSYLPALNAYRKLR